jgi:membrane-associated phospholipid phosphatase
MSSAPTPEYRKNELTALLHRRSAARDGETRYRLSPRARPRLGQLLLDEVAAVLAGCGTFEWVALSYLAISGALIGIFAQNLAHPVRLLGVQALVAVAIVALCRSEENVWTEGRCATTHGERRAARDGCLTFTQRFWHFWRHWYPHLFFLFCFEELGVLVHLVSPRWQDAKLISFDHWLTGLHPSIWLEQFATPGRNEFMQFAYLTYFVYLVVLGGILYYRADWRGYWSVMTYSGVAYAIGYLIAIFFPIESPWFAMAGAWHAELRGGPFTAVINFIEHYGRVRGAAFPSEHVAGSFAALWGAWRHRRCLFWIMLPLVLCMCVSTVWGRYHYVADIFAGIVTGTMGYLVGKWLMERGERVTVGNVTEGAMEPSLVRQ